MENVKIVFLHQNLVKAFASLQEKKTKNVNNIYILRQFC